MTVGTYSQRAYLKETPMSDLDARVARLERIAGASGYNLHEFDDPDQAAAHAKQVEADAKAEERAQAQAAKAANQEGA